MAGRILSYGEFMALPNDAVLTPAELAHVFKVDPKTITRWSSAGKLESIRTLGGHRRYLKLDVVRAMKEAEQDITQGIPQAVRTEVRT